MTTVIAPCGSPACPHIHRISADGRRYYDVRCAVATCRWRLWVTPGLRVWDVEGWAEMAAR